MAEEFPNAEMFCSGEGDYVILCEQNNEQYHAIHRSQWQDRMEPKTG